MHRKYENNNFVVPFEKRKEINEKIIRLINLEKCEEQGITNEDIFNAYTGDGGLHNLNFADFDNYHQYSEEKKKIENGQFFTSHQVAEMIMDSIRPSRFDLVADLTCGMGNFFNYVENEMNVYGNEIDSNAFKVAKQLYPKANLENKDIRYYKPGVKFDIVVGNPPFNLQWKTAEGDMLSQEYYTKKAAKLLKPGGMLMMLVPKSFLADEFSDAGMIERINQELDFIMQANLPADAFKSLGVVKFETKIMLFRKKAKSLQAQPYRAEFDGDGLTSAQIYERFVEPIVQSNKSLKNVLLLEQMRSSNEEEGDFLYKVKKLLFDIKRNPKISEHYGRADAYFHKFLNQEKPAEMEWSEWRKVRITERKVLAYMKRIISKQSAPPIRDEIRLVKTSFGLKLKAYSPKMKKQLPVQTYSSFNDMVLGDYYPFADSRFERLLAKKAAHYQQHKQEFNSLAPKKIESLERFAVESARTGKRITLLQTQKDDVSKVLQKDYGILNWQMGGGKTLAALAWADYYFSENKIQNAFVVSQAISINMTWEKRLIDYGKDFIHLKTITDVAKIKPGQIVLVTFGRLSKLSRHIKKHLKLISNKIGLIVDESDDLANPRSARTKETLSVFRRAKYKLLTTGTTTRNTSNELYSQIELLYNNSINMLCECEEVFKRDKKSGEMQSLTNERLNEPFDARHGYSLFRSCFSPEKKTVFGAEKMGQDIYNADLLAKLIRRTIITRTLEEIAGRKLDKVDVINIRQNKTEEKLHEKIMVEFEQMVKSYFRSTGVDKKDSMLKLARQIQLLIKSTSIPHTFMEYQSNRLPEKFLRIRDEVRKLDEKVAIGTVFVKAAQDYYKVMKESFPERKVFLVTGEVPFKKRLNIIDEFQATSNGILVSTQGSMKSSIDVPECDQVFIESMLWNIPKIEQYYFRFIRLISSNLTRVHFVTYEDTIEQNVLALLMAKEKINNFVKTQDTTDYQTLFDEYGVDPGIFDHIIQKVKGEDERSYLSWGKQKIS